MLHRSPIACLLATMLVALAVTPSRAAFDLAFRFTNPSQFTPSELAVLQTAADEAEALWESKITGYAPGIPLTGLTIDITAINFDIAFGRVDASSTAGGFLYTTRGTILVNPASIPTFESWFQNGLNLWDEIMIHEAAHVMGFGNNWVGNGVYNTGSGQYTGAHGLAAYRREFDPTASHIPVELGGGGGVANVHWDQLLRSDPSEGNPSDPFAIEPFIGVTDSRGRDFSLELMTAKLDPDYGEPFLSQTTIYSLRDLGFTTVPEPSTSLLTALAVVLGIRSRTRR